MRTLTSIQSADTILSEFSIDITATDASTTWTFNGDDIVDIGKISWEIPFGGGVGKTSNYSITLSSSMGFMKENRSNLLRAETNLKVTVNSDTFYPHVGRVRGIKRTGTDPHKFSLQIFDRFLDTNPTFPESLQDSYTGLHPETVNAGIGHPVYYGLHSRPPFHTPVDCSLSTLIGPRGVSFNNHVSSCWFMFDNKYGADETQKTTALLNKDWAQESASTNLITGGEDFEVKDVSITDVRLFKYTGKEANRDDSENSGVSNDEGIFKATLGDKGGAAPKFMRPDITQVFNVSTVTYFTLQTSFAPGTMSGASDLAIGIEGMNESNYWSKELKFQSTSAPYTTSTTNSWDDFTATSTPAVNFLSDNQNNSTSGFSTNIEPNTGTTSGGTLSLLVAGTCRSEQYKNFSVFSDIVNPTDVAVSENPVYILSHIFSEYTKTPFVQSQASDSQVDVNNYKFQCGFYKRKELGTIMDEFGKITATNLWIGDSGTVNLRTYQESSGASIDATITTSDMMSFSISENPLGSSRYNSQKAQRIGVNYNYSFGAGLYKKSLQADPLNDTFCEAVSSAGIDSEIVEESKHIIDTDTASYYLGNLVRFFTQDESFVDISLPAKFMQLEVSDIIKVQHPMIINSESLYQITDADLDLMKGRVKIKASEILNLS